MQNVLSRGSPFFGRHVKPLFPAEFAIVSAHQSALGPRGGLWSVLLYIIYKDSLSLSSGYINRLMMMMMMILMHNIVETFKYQHSTRAKPGRVASSP
jgi:hypothetical protein